MSVARFNSNHPNHCVLLSVFEAIFRGEVTNWRHEAFKEGGKARSNLRFKVCFGAFKERQRDFMSSRLLKVFCPKHNKYLPVSPAITVFGVSCVCVCVCVCVLSVSQSVRV